MVKEVNYLLHSVISNGIRRNIEDDEVNYNPLIVNASLIDKNGNYIEDIEEVYDRKSDTKSFNELLKKFSQPKVINKLRINNIPVFVLEFLPIGKINNVAQLKKMEQDGKWMNIKHVSYIIISHNSWTNCMGSHRYPNNKYNYFKISATGERIKFRNLGLKDIFRQGGRRTPVDNIPPGEPTEKWEEENTPSPILDIKYASTGGILKFAPIIGIEEKYIELNQDNDLIILLFKAKLYNILKDINKLDELINITKKAKNIINIIPPDIILPEPRCQFSLETIAKQPITNTMEYRVLQINHYFLNELKDNLLPKLKSFPDIYIKLDTIIKDVINTLSFTKP